CWTFSRYADVDFALCNPQIFSSAKWLAQSIGDLNPAPEVPWMIESDPPDHTHLRKLVNKGFTPRMVVRLEPQIRAIARELLENHKDFIAQQRKQQQNDLITSIVQAEEERQVLTADEILAMSVLILAAGNETTMNLLSNTVLALAEHPEAATRVRTDRTLV